MSVIKIQCPACGSNSTFKLFDGNYKCNYCQSNFSVNESQPNVTRPQTGPRPQVTAPAKSNPKIVMAVAFGVFLLMGVGAATFLVTGSVMDPVEIKKVTELQKPNIRLTYSFAGGRGAVIWIIYEQYRSVDSIWYELQIVDPKTNQLKAKESIVPVFKLNDNLDFNKKVANEFRQYGDLAYNISQNNGFVAYNIYSGKIEINTQTLVKDFPELKSGILKVEQLSSENAFSITTISGDVFKFDPYNRILIAKKDQNNKRNVEEVTSDIYLSAELKHQLYVLTKKGDGFPVLSSGMVGESYVTDLDVDKGKSIKDIFGNIYLKKISDKSYFAAQSLLRDDQGNLILFYKSDLSEKATVILESVNKDGKTNWSVQDPLFLKIGKAFGSENIGAIYGHSKNLLLLFIPSEKQAHMGIDIKSGKILWTFYPETYLEEHLQSIN